MPYMGPFTPTVKKIQNARAPTYPPDVPSGVLVHRGRDHPLLVRYGWQDDPENHMSDFYPVSSRPSELKAIRPACLN
jgi:hypothetical protein